MCARILGETIAVQIFFGSIGRPSPTRTVACALTCSSPWGVKQISVAYSRDPTWVSLNVFTLVNQEFQLQSAERKEPGQELTALPDN